MTYRVLEYVSVMQIGNLLVPVFGNSGMKCTSQVWSGYEPNLRLKL